MFLDQLLASTEKKNMMNRTQICNVEIQIKETRTLLRAKIVIKGNVKISKFQNIKVGNFSIQSKFGKKIESQPYIC